MIERRDLRRPEPTGPLDRAKRTAVLITANARWEIRRTDAIGDVRRVDPSLSVDQKIVEALLDRAQ